MPTVRLTQYLLRWEEMYDAGRDVPAAELCPTEPAVAGELQRAIDSLKRARLNTVPPSDTPSPPTVAPTSPGPAATPAAPPLPAGGLPPADLPPGYELLGELGHGGMGVVYKARHLGLNRAVALKMIRSGRHATADDRLRFLAEAESVAKVRHPGIVQVYDFGTHAGLSYFSLELCSGGSLADKLDAGPLPPAEAAALVAKVARAVQAAHEAGIVHRDLKPGNVLLADGGEPRVTDFGLAKRVEGGSGLTVTGAVMGTPSYMAPEQAAGRTKEVGPLADVYALGAILYECLVGRPPFRAASVMETLMQVVGAEPAAPRSLNAKVPRDLETVCLRCLEKAPGKRYGSAAELADDLGRYLAGRPVAARPVGRAERLWRWCRREPVMATLLAAVVLALAAGAAVSTMFALQARDEAVRADERAGEAERAAHKEAAARKDAQRQAHRADSASHAVLLEQAVRALVDHRDGSRAEELLVRCPQSLENSWEHRHVLGLYDRLSHTAPTEEEQHTNPVNSVAFSPDGKRVASGSDDKTVRVWEADTARELLTLKGDHQVTIVAYSRGGKRLVSGNADGGLRVSDCVGRQGGKRGFSEWPTVRAARACRRAARRWPARPACARWPPG